MLKANFGDHVNPMGLFCSVTMPIKCPYCGTENVRECRTKELRGMFLYEHWKVGDDVLADFPKELHCYTDCDCVESWESGTFPNGQEREGHRNWYVKVKLANGVITGEYEVFKEVEDEDEYG
ncbi:MAG: hypothetical protein JST41_11790 [Bacteroidetes bacterium]|jgi:hypothetical protein|nr:hypothetical protein [Bacteroidota bacterium]MBX7128655.1 hypothetical protein [Flavobacteriales bacterium]HMU12940.1 hypothetical protein [Flavobacteriales bacterium]HMW96158.1 hypothetical protein [Flavobacteriales bacterium]HMZ48076.1 hypothetical protein [Flavobacteriales bacterium]